MAWCIEISVLALTFFAKSFFAQTWYGVIRYVPAEIPTLISFGSAFHGPNHRDVSNFEGADPIRTCSPPNSQLRVFQKKSFQSETILGGPLLS